MGMRKTHEEFVKEVTSSVGDEYRVVSEYVDSKTPITFRHFCGTEIMKSPDGFLQKNKKYCPSCHGAKEFWNDEKYKRMVEKEGQGEYAVLGVYTGMSNPIKIEHINCGLIYERTARMFKGGGRCPNCQSKNAGQQRKISHEEFISRLPKTFNEEYTLLSAYDRAKTKVLVRHNNCGREYYTYPGNAIRGNGCDYCARKSVQEQKRKHASEDFYQHVSSVDNGEYVILGDYVTALKKVQIQHLKCGNIYDVRPNDFKSGCRCPLCYESKGENKIRVFLEKEGIQFKRELSFDNCVYKHKLRFDFGIYDNNGKITNLIEFDGKQHYEPSEHFGIQSFIETKSRDAIKDEFCKKKGIKLLRIPYWEFNNIENILGKEVSGI